MCVCVHTIHLSFHQSYTELTTVTLQWVFKYSSSDSVLLCFVLKIAGIMGYHWLSAWWSKEGNLIKHMSSGSIHGGFLRELTQNKALLKLWKAPSHREEAKWNQRGKRVSACRHPFCHELPEEMELDSTTPFGHDELKLWAKVNHSFLQIVSVRHLAIVAKVWLTGLL